MEIEIISAKKFAVKLKATIHITGKLGFTEATAKELRLTQKSGIKFAKDANETLYLINCPNCDDDSFQVAKAGMYYSINTKPLFDSLGYDYKSENIMFDLVREKHDAYEIYKLIKRAKPRKN